MYVNASIFSIHFSYVTLQINIKYGFPSHSLALEHFSLDRLLDP